MQAVCSWLPTNLRGRLASPSPIGSFLSLPVVLCHRITLLTCVDSQRNQLPKHSSFLELKPPQNLLADGREEGAGCTAPVPSVGRKVERGASLRVCIRAEGSAKKERGRRGLWTGGHLLFLLLRALLQRTSSINLAGLQDFRHLPGVALSCPVVQSLWLGFALASVGKRAHGSAWVAAADARLSLSPDFPSPSRMVLDQIPGSPNASGAEQQP
mmetsp:Transcript_36266/g.86055  ORF Transcript_36266/g.86055 Transcript_36266/m.86055 type:complete len:213 (+) Transcript_36266:95-733(+)